MPPLRRLNAKGIESFRTFLRSIRAGGEFQASPAILYVDEYSSAITPAVRIDDRTFSNRLELARHLVDLLEPLEATAAINDAGLWSWLALFYFDQLSPVGADGHRRPREDYHYIPAPGMHRAERHLIAAPWRLYRMHGESARLLLSAQVHQHGRFAFDLTSRRDLVTNRGLIAAIDRLYWNRKTDRPKRGATTETRPGNLRRLISVIQQLDVNYDLYGMSSDEILELLPPEFAAWA